MKAIDFGSEENFKKVYDELKSARKVAEFFSCSKSTVLNYAKKIGYDNTHNKIIKITDVPIEQIIQDYEELQSVNKVGQKYSCSGTAIRNYLIKNGYNLTRYQAKLKDITPEDFIQNYEELKSSYKMAILYNCSNTAILNYAKKIGYDVNLNKEYKLSNQDKKEIIEAYNIASSGDLAKKYNCTRGMITKIWYDNNLLGKEIKYYHTREIDLTGQKIGLWTILYKTDKRDNGGNIYWHCKCECGIEKDVLSSSLRQGTSLSCGSHANISKGNEKIKYLLQKANIPFETEKKFCTCKDKKELPFDFYINNQYLLEYDGYQHYIPETIFDYEYTHAHDLIKSKWCKENNIPLIRIPYTQYEKLSLEDLLLKTSSFLEK